VDTVYFRDHNENGAEINNLINDVEQTGYYSGNPAGQDAHIKVNLGLTIFDQDGLLVDLFLNNATNEMTRSSSSVDNNTSAGFPGRYASPRTWGLRLNMNF